MNIIILVLLFSVLFLFLFGNWVQDKMIYFPSPEILGSPKDYDLSYEEVYFETPDGIKLHGWFVTHTPQKNAVSSGNHPTLLFFHGNAGNIGSRAENIAQMAQLGINIFAIDYRGYGKSQGKPSEKGLYQDARAAYEELTKKRQIPSQEIIVFGRSLGAAVAIELASKVPIGKLWIEAPFPNTHEMAKQVFPLPLIPLHWFTMNRFNSLERVSQLKMDKLITHGTKDTIIPLLLGKKLYQQMSEPKKMHIVEGGNHNDLPWIGGDNYWKTIEAFIAQ